MGTVKLSCRGMAEKVVVVISDTLKSGQFNSHTAHAVKWFNFSHLNPDKVGIFRVLLSSSVGMVWNVECLNIVMFM